MMKIIQRLVKEPLLHFFIMGAILYGYYLQTQKNTTNLPSKTVIKISNYEIDEIKSNYKKMWHKDINDVELKSLIEKKYHDKALLNEAYLLNLEKQDEVISKRLLKKMHFIMLNSAKIIEPTEKELEEYYKKHIVDYSKIKNISVAQVFFPISTDKSKINFILNLLKDGVKPKDASYFSQSSPIPNQLDNLTFEDAKKMFGNYAASKLFKLKIGIWHKPIQSKVGLHIFYIKDKTIVSPYPFDEVQGRVYEDFMADFKHAIEQKAFDRIISAYKLEIK